MYTHPDKFEEDLKFTKKWQQKTFYKGATSMYFGMEPTMA